MTAMHYQSEVMDFEDNSMDQSSSKMPQLGIDTDPLQTEHQAQEQMDGGDLLGGRWV